MKQYKEVQEDFDYIKEWVESATNIKIDFNWFFDEQQADPYHHNWSHKELIKRMKRFFKNYTLREETFEKVFTKEVLGVLAKEGLVT